MRFVWEVFLSSAPVKAHAVSQTAGGTLRGDLHLGGYILTTSINHQSGFPMLPSLDFTLRAHA